MFKISYPDSLTFSLRYTPIQYLKNISSQYAPYRLWIKRDDLTGIELSGNKVRKLDFLLHEAIAQDCKHIFTCGGLQSNHCRATAFMGAKLGMKCRLYLRGEKPAMPAGNYFLDFLSGAEIEFVTPEEYQRIDQIMSNDAGRLRDRGENVYIVPEGGSNATGVWGYIRCFQEIEEQIRERRLNIDVIIVATGSGGTHAGLLIGKILLASSIEVVSVNVCDNAVFFKQKISQIIDEFKRKYRIEIDIEADEIKIIDGYVGAGYGLIGVDEVELIKHFARNEGIILDPVYGAKAFYGLQTMLTDKKLAGKNILFIHTGGIFGVFPLADQFL